MRGRKRLDGAAASPPGVPASSVSAESFARLAYQALAKLPPAPGDASVKFLKTFLQMARDEADSILHRATPSEEDIAFIRRLERAGRESRGGSSETD